MRVRVMTNPAQLLLAGNPGKKHRRTKARAAKTAAKTAATTNSTRAAIRKELSAMMKEVPMPKRRKARKSKASTVARVAKRRARRATRKGKQPSGLRAYWAKRKAKASGRVSKRRSKRRSRKARLHVKRARKSRKSKSRNRARRIKNVYASAGTTVAVRKVRHGRVRRSSRKYKRSARRVGVVGVNAGSLTLTGGVLNFVGNAKATMKDGVKGFAFAFGGAAVSVAGGAFTSQVTGNLLARFAPALLRNPIASRLLGAVNYYLPGWAASKFIPGLSGKSRRAMLTGAVAAALLEVVRPGMIRGALQRVPVIGGLMDAAEDQASDLGAYVGYALNGNGDNGANGAADMYPAPGGMSDYVALNGYESTDGEDAAQNMGVEDYVSLR